MYSQVDSNVIAGLQAIVGEDHVILDRERLEPYTHDETLGVIGWPEVVVRPSCTDEVSAIMKLADEYVIPVTPRAGGYGLSGGAVPLKGGIVLSMERMNHILEIDHQNLMITVEPGVITGDVHRAVEAEGLFYPPDPASQDSCCIGGNIAEGAGGPRAVKYGTTKDYVSGLKVVLANGDVMELGGKLVKNVAGYNLIQLIVGSEGTLGIVTEIVLRLLPLPAAQIDLLVPYDDFQNAADTVADIIARGIVPTTLEFMERECVKASEALLNKTVPFSDAAAHLLIQMTGKRSEDLEADLDEVGEICLEHGALDVLVAQDRPTRDRLWEARRVIIDAFKHASPVSLTEDVSVPRSQIPTLLRGIHEISERIGICAYSFGHAGDGNVHIQFMRYDMPDDIWSERLLAARKELYRLALSVKGTITGEHGVGATRSPYLVDAVGARAVQIMQGIKGVLDPKGILNPGKIFV
ncbi:MAG: FAD-binding protein [Anaerolineae bacterium]|nr:FAD-binding protein [Anaerolineae bacterium]